VRREVKHFIETCDFCKTDFHVTSENPSMLQSVYYFYYGGYGDQQRFVEAKDVCSDCFMSALNSGYGKTPKDAGYIGNLKR